MNENCETVRGEIALTGRAPENQTMREHFASCEECSRLLEKVAALETELRALPEKDAPDELVAKLLARPELRTRRHLGWRAWTMALGTAASVFLLIWAWRGVLREVPESPVVSQEEIAPPARPAPQAAPEERQKAEDSGYGTEGAASPAPTQPSLGLASRRNEAEMEADDKLSQDLEKKDQAVAGGRVDSVTGFLELRDEDVGAKRIHRDPIYPEAAKAAGVEGTVVLELTVGREGNVDDVRVIESIPLLDAAAIEAARAWKYAPSESETPRRFRVSIPFELDSPQQEELSLLEERERIEGLRFLEPKGYWANTYLPGDPRMRELEWRLSGVSLPHEDARPAELPLDPTSSAALSVFVHADRRAVTGRSRLLVRVGIRAREHHGRRRPPRNVGVVVHLPQPVAPEQAASLVALLESLEAARELGDRFRLVVAGTGEVLIPETFGHGPLSVALSDLLAGPGAGSASDAMALALERVHAGDDPTMPLGTSLVVLVTGGRLEAELPAILGMVQKSAVGGVSVSAVGLPGAEAEELERLALAGQGRLYTMSRASEAPDVMDRELSAGARAVARALRLRIRLAEGVQLVGVLGSEPLGAKETERVRAEEKSIDLRLARNLGIEADRGDDEDGIQMVIPSFYAGDAHSILLDVVAGAGPIADVTVRYKDLVQLENTVARASLALPRGERAAGPLEVSVLKSYLDFRISEELEAAARSAHPEAARLHLEKACRLLSTAVPGDRDLARDRVLLDAYLRDLFRVDWSLLRDSLLYASALKLSPTLS